MTEKSAVERLKSVVNYANYPAQLAPLSADSEKQRLLVGPGAYMFAQGQYDPQRPVVMEMAFLNDVLRSNALEPNPKVDYLQFMLDLPFEVPQEQHGAVCELIAVFNLLVPFGGFGLHENGKPTFRYEHLVNREQDFEAFVVIEILNTLMFFIENLGYKIEALATGQDTLEQMLNEAIHFDPRPQQAAQ